MKAYAREKAKDEAAQLTADQVAACNCQQSAVVNVLPLSPLEELLIAHPTPWTCQANKLWRGKDPPDPILYDARWDVVEICDDPSWRPAIAQAVNLAAAIACSIEDIGGENGCRGK